MRYQQPNQNHENNHTATTTCQPIAKQDIDNAARLSLCRVMPYTPDQERYIIENHERLSRADLAADVGKSKSAITNFLHRRGLLDCSRFWTDTQIAMLVDAYKAKVKSEIKLDELSAKIGKLKSNVCRKAKEMGLTDQKKAVLRPEDRKGRNKYKNPMDLSLAMSASRKQWHVDNEHPRGALGMKHSPSTRKKISIKSKNYNDSLSADQKFNRVKKMLKTKVKNGTYSMPRHKTTWKSGWREIGGIRKFYRSRWEANYAYFLQMLLESGEISEWKHEPDTFWFDGIRRGCVSYLPDFRVTRQDGSIYYVEVKGWMDPRSVTKLKRMKKYHPKTELQLVDSNAYRKMERSIGGLVKGWEM